MSLGVLMAVSVCSGQPRASFLSTLLALILIILKQTQITYGFQLLIAFLISEAWWLTLLSALGRPRQADL